MILVAVVAYKYGHYEGTTGKTQAHGHAHAGEREGYAAHHNAEEYAYEHSDEVGFVQVFLRIAKTRGQAVYVLLLAHHREAVSYLETQVGGSQQVHACTGDTGDIQLEAHAQAQLAELLAVVFALGDHHAAAYHMRVVGVGLFGSLPVLVHHRTQESLEQLLVLHGNHHQEHVVHLEHGAGLGYDESAVRLLQTRDDEIAGYELVELVYGKAGDKVVAHLESHHMRPELRLVLVFLHPAYLLVHVYLVEFADNEHGHYDAHHAEGISGGIAHRHVLGKAFGQSLVSRHGLYHSLLCGSEPRGVGHGSAHHAHHLRDLHGASFASLYPIKAHHEKHVEADACQGQHIEAHATLLERGEEAGAHLHTYGENEKDEAEIPKEIESIRCCGVMEMPHQDTDKQHESHSERHAENLDLAQPDTRENHERVQQNRTRKGHLLGLE